jgi:putative endonuclease
MNKSFTVYILRTSKNTLYVGQTNNVEKRMLEHKKHKKGAKYMRAFTSFELVYKEEFETRSEALKREWELKRLSRAKKEALIGEMSSA